MQIRTINTADMATTWNHTDHGGGFRPSPKTNVISYDGQLEHTAEVMKAVGENRIGDPCTGWISSKVQESWLGRKVQNWKELEQMVREPWPEGIAKIQKMADAIMRHDLPQPVVKRRKMIWSEESGDEFDYDRYRSGQAYWREARRRPTGGPQVITMVVNTCGSCMLTAEKLLWRGAACMALATVLEQAGYCAEIISIQTLTETCRSANEYKYANIVQGQWIKRVGDLFDLSSLANGVSPWYFRTLTFAGLDLVPGYRAMPGLGFPMKITPEMVEAFDPAVAGRAVWIIDGVFEESKSVSLCSLFLDRLTSERIGAA